MNPHVLSEVEHEYRSYQIATSEGWKGTIRTYENEIISGPPELIGKKFSNSNLAKFFLCNFWMQRSL